MIKRSLNHKINQEYISNTLQVIIETSFQKILVATTYLPSRRANIPFPDIHEIAYNDHPAYLTGDMNVKHTTQQNNKVGKNLDIFIKK